MNTSFPILRNYELEAPYVKIKSIQAYNEIIFC